MTGQELIDYGVSIGWLSPEKAEELKKLLEQKKGHWEMNSDHPDRLICSECNSQFDVWHWESKQMHFCPNCGADMRKDGEKE